MMEMSQSAGMNRDELETRLLETRTVGARIRTPIAVILRTALDSA
jgi:hypothetical protein